MRILLEEPASVEPRDYGSDRWWWVAAWVVLVAGIGARLWGLGAHDLTFDEAFTGSAVQRPVGELLDHLRERDTHPPLDYLTRMPFAATGSELLLRLPSLVWSVGTLLVLVRWMHRKGPFGAMVVMTASFLPFLVLHGREARMYALVMFLGTVAGMSAERWLDRPSLQRCLGVAVPSLLAVLSHSAALPAVAAFGLLPGLRRDRSAWVYRACLLGAGLTWAALWGPSFLTQTSSISSFWIPLSSPDWIETVSAALVTSRAALVHGAAALLTIGAVLLVWRRDGLGRVALLAFVLPFVGVAVVGFEAHVLLPRSFAFGAWAVAAALAAVVDDLRTRLGPGGLVLGTALVAMLIVPSTLEVARDPRERHVALEELRTRLRTGDRIAISPSYFGPVIEWEFVVKDGFVREGVDEDGRFVIIDDSKRPSGRTHLLEHSRLPIDDSLIAGRDRCEEDLHTASWLLRCVER